MSPEMRCLSPLFQKEIRPGCGFRPDSYTRWAVWIDPTSSGQPQQPPLAEVGLGHSHLAVIRSTQIGPPPFSALGGSATQSAARVNRKSYLPCHCEGPKGAKQSPRPTHQIASSTAVATASAVFLAMTRRDFPGSLSEYLTFRAVKRPMGASFENRFGVRPSGRTRCLQIRAKARTPNRFHAFPAAKGPMGASLENSDRKQAVRVVSVSGPTGAKHKKGPWPLGTAKAPDSDGALQSPRRRDARGQLTSFRRRSQTCGA